MNSIDKIVDLLQKEISFVLVKIYETHKAALDACSPIIVTQEESFGDYGIYTQELIAEARKSLKKGKSYSFRNFMESFDVCFEYFCQQKTLVIVGAGHIAVPLCHTANLLGFKTVVIDDRKDCVTSERFPKAQELLVSPYTEGLQNYPIDHNTYIVLVTPGHVYDRDCLKILLQKGQAAYIGMICSTRRKEATWKLMRAEGYSQELLDQIYAPIGLPIGGETPEEIAISIISEIIALRNKGKDWVWSIKKNPFYSAKTTSEKL